jgi:hypothetical protein
MDENYQTSQQKAGEHSLTEGKAGGPTESTGTDDGGGRGSFTKTSQQIREEHDKPEGD